jgi:hypothetical protein
VTVRAAPVQRAVEAFVRRGGSTSEHVQNGDAKPVLLNVPADLLQRIDEAVKARPLRTHRTTWILEAILEKLERG